MEQDKEPGHTLNTFSVRRLSAAVGIGVAVVVSAYLLSPDTELRDQNPGPAHEQDTGCELESPERAKYPTHTVIATTYWIGEPPSQENHHISNLESQWDSNAVATFGGVDTPEGRNFTPLHNTYYFALPAGEFTRHELVDEARQRSPWADEAANLAPDESLFKGRWIEVCQGDKTIYAQWHDTGPFETDDFDYVFGAATPRNSFGQRAGLDLSPDAADALGTQGSATVRWHFVEASEVPEGPWTTYPPISDQINW